METRLIVLSFIALFLCLFIGNVMHGQSARDYPAAYTVAQKSVSELDKLLTSPVGWAEMPNSLMEYLHYPSSFRESAVKGEQSVESANDNVRGPVILDMEVMSKYGGSSKRSLVRRRAYKRHKVATK